MRISVDSTDHSNQLDMLWSITEDSLTLPEELVVPQTRNGDEGENVSYFFD